MTDTKQQLPSYKKPPVSEVAVSVDFVPLPKWGIPHYGKFWAEIDAEYPRFEVQPPLISQIERFGEDTWQQKGDGLTILTGVPEVRCWFCNDKGALLQVQRDRLVVNWRQMIGDERYPRYDQTIRPMFEREWSRFADFIDRHDLGQPEVRQCELTYVNDLEKGIAWNTLADLPKLCSQWSGKGTDGFLPTPHTASINTAFDMPDKLGRLYTIVQHVLRSRDHAEVLQMKLTARGAPQSSNIGDLLKWFDMGREWIVRGFTDLTTSEAHRMWERER